MERLGIFLVGVLFAVAVPVLLILDRTHFGESTEHIIQATVIEKEYVPKSTHTAIVPMGKTMMPQTRTRPEEFNVKVKWEGGIYTIDSEAKFNSYEVGDSIPVTCITWFRKDGSIRRKFIKE